MGHDDERTRTLLNLVKRNRDELHIEYKGFLSNHMSHYLVALYKLGASSKRLQEAFDEYRDGLEARHPPEGIKIRPIGQEDEETGTHSWSSLRGKRKYYSDLVNFFAQQIEAEGLRAVINRYIPHLLNGMDGAAFHGLIQLGYALEIQDASNVAEGLAYMTHCWYNVGDVPEDESKLSRKGPFELLQELHEDPYFEHTLDHVHKSHDYGKFQSRIHYLVEADDGKHLEHLANYDIFLPLPDEADDETIKRKVDDYVRIFSLCVLKVFGSCGCDGFFLLHLVTGMRALKKVILELDDPKMQVHALRQFWRCAMCAYVALDRPAARDIDELSEEQRKRVEGESWDEIVEKTMPSPDEHLVKLVFVCRTEAEEYPEAAELFKQVAAFTRVRLSEKDWNYNS